ncbi:hypothetical protein KF840_12930 [bacterium]|nr:hypothetical protein [bacterium]
MRWNRDSVRRSEGRWRLVAGGVALALFAAPAAAAVRVTIGAASGARSDIVWLPVQFESGGEAVAAVDMILALPDDGAEVLRNGRGDPACAVEPGIDKGSSVFRFLPAGCGAESATPCRALRALILSLYDVDPIPDGPLFTCRMRITASQVGVVPVACESAAAGSPDQRLLPVACGGGGVIVQSVATPTPTFTPTRTWTPRPFGSPTPTPAARLRIGTGAGNPGDLVDVPVRLSADAPVVGALVDLVLPNGGAEFAATGSGLPDCAVNPQIGKEETAFAFQPYGCTPGLDCATVRAVVLSFRNVAPIPGDVELFSCRLRLASGAAGVVPLVCGVAQTSPPQAGNHLIDLYPTTCSGGGIIVSSAGTSTPTRTRTATPTPVSTSTRTPLPSETASSTASATATPTPTDSPPPTSTEPPPTPTDSPLPSPTASATPPPTATPPRCLGDCNGDGRVSVDELVRGVAIALGNVPFTECPALDRNGDGEIAVYELITAVNAALAGCPRAP